MSGTANNAVLAFVHQQEKKVISTTAKNTLGSLGVIALTGLVSPFANAVDSAWYIGGNVGQTRATIDDARISRGLLGSGFATTGISDDNRDTGFKLFGGYQFNPYIGLEGGYFDLGKFGFNATTNPAGSLNGSIKLRGVNLDLVGTLPIAGGLSAFGRVGVNYAQARDHFTGTGAVRVLNADPSKRGANVKYGAGLQYAFTDNFAMRAEVERYRINDAVGNKGDVDMVSLGLIYRFGDKSPSRVAPAPMQQPVVVAAAPAPAPVIAAPPPPPVSNRVTFAADSLFDFDKSVIKPAGKQALDKLAADLRDTRFELVTVTGHTDRLGSHAYNLKLSARRAEAVKAYLAQAAGISADKITATGVNGANPVTNPADCKGNKPTPKLIACLQPDRRVDVEVTGTR